MRQVLRRAVVAAVAGSMLLAGCTTTVDGTASAARQLTDVTAQELPITGAGDDDVDRYARNAMADLLTFWEEAYPEVYRESFTPLEGGIFSVDSENLDHGAYPAYGIGCPSRPTDPEVVANNAHYNTRCDVIAYDAALLRALGEEYGPFIGPAVMAHEMGHAVQNRFGYSDSSVLDETQADCFAGAFTGWVTEGNAAHVTVRTSELDDVVIAFLGLRDPVGSDPEDDRAHGSGFDRVSGFLTGYEDGVTACRDEFGPDRVVTGSTFTSADDAANEGDAPYGDLETIITTSLSLFYESWVPDFQEPRIETFDGRAPDCGDMGAEDRDLGFCAADGTVYVDERDLLRPAYDDIGDFAVATAVSLPYALAVRAQLGLSTDDATAAVSAVCLTGVYAARFFSGDFADTGIALSPGDIDEATIFLLAYGQQEAVFPGVQAHGFELVGTFRAGFLQGAGACDLEP